MASWLEDIVESMTELGGISHYSDLYEKVKEVRAVAAIALPVSWQAIIRRVVETNSSDSEAFR